MLSDIKISYGRARWEIVDVMVEDGWIERQPGPGRSLYWRFGDRAPDPCPEEDQVPYEEPSDITNPIVTQLTEALELTLQLTTRQAVALGSLEQLLELLNNLQTSLDPRIMSRVQLGIIAEMQAAAKPAEA